MTGYEMPQYVDPRFGAELRRLREKRGLSLRELSAASYVSKSVLSRYENAGRSPSPENAAHLDRVLDADGMLVALAVPAELSPGEAERADRIAHATRAPRHLDRAAVDSLAGVLASHRHLDDAMPVDVLWPIASAHHRTLTDIATQARGPNAPALHLVVAESLQFIGWLCAQRGQHDRADRMYAQSADRADQLGAGGLASQSRRFRGALAWQLGHHTQMVQHYTHAAQTPGAGVLHRINAELRRAHGLALLDDHAAAVRTLHVANDMATAAHDAVPEPFAYWLTSAWLRFPLGMTYLELGRPQDAAQNLRAGLDSLSDYQRGTPWTAQYRNALKATEAEG